MMIGHYSTALAAKAVDTRLPLGVLFIACQFVDILWAALVLGGVEHVELTPGFTASNPLDLRYMPYTHSLTAALAWGLVAIIVWSALRAWRGWQGAALIVGVVVTGHWLCDLLVHVPDLPLYGNQHKVGLGLWEYRYPALALEAAMFIGALALYYRATRPRTRGGTVGPIILVLVMVGIQAGSLFGPLPENATELGVTGLVGFGLFALLAEWLDRKRG
jgi:hypothetical protein